MNKIAFIGAGSFGFTRNLIRDILSYPQLQNSSLYLMDIDSEKLGYIKQAVDRIIREGKYTARVFATTDRKEALKNAGAVVCTILVGDVEVWRHDIEIPMKYGVDINVGDTRGPSGILRALRTIPVMLDICRDMEELCPDAILLNYTNPMAMLCRAMQRESRIQVSGLCHSVQGTAAKIAGWIGIPPSELKFVCAGINHQAWYLSLEHKGRDAYPLLREAVKKPDVYNEEIVRSEMFLHLGCYVTESSGHNSEYNWWFRKRPDLIEKYCRDGTGWNPGHHAYILKDYLKRKKSWVKEIQNWLEDKNPLDLRRGNEYAASIINAYFGGEPFRFNGNVPNRGLIPNLPQNACVEVPVYADAQGFNPVYVGELPPQCAALNNISIASEEMAVEGCLSGDRDKIFHAVAYDPLSAAVLSLSEIKSMVNEMFDKNKGYLPTFT